MENWALTEDQNKLLSLYNELIPTAKELILKFIAIFVDYENNDVQMWLNEDSRQLLEQGKVVTSEK